MNDRARRSTYCLVLIFCLFCPNSFAADCDSLPKSGSFLSYTIQPKPADGSVSLDATVRFRLNGRKATVLVLPSEWEGQRELYRAIHDLEVVSPGSTLQPAEGPSKRRVNSVPGQMVELHYSVAKDWTGKIDASSYFRVLMESSYFQVAGHNFLVYPNLPEDEELPIRLEWKNLPQGWRVVDSLAGDSLCQAATTRLIKLTNGLFTGGELRITKVDVEGTPVFVATRGEWQFSDGSFVELAQRILTAERGFWHDIGFPNYLITLLPSDDSSGNYGATALEDSFTFLTGESAQLDFATKFLLAHEMFHSWNAAKLGEIHEQKPFWFIEGFTDYYARLLLRNAGLISAEQYQRDVDSVYAEYLTSRVVHASGKDVESKFFDDSDLQRIAYLRGNFLAIKWDQAIRRRSGNKQSLDDAMLNLYRMAQRKELVLTNAFLGEHFSSYVGPEAVSDVRRYIEQGETIPRPGSNVDPPIGK